MSTLDECNQAFRYIGYDRFRYDVDDDEFKNRLKNCTKPHNHIDYINAIRSYAIFSRGKTLKEREHLVRTYFDKINGTVACAIPKKFPIDYGILEVFKVHPKEDIYCFRPLIRHCYFYRYQRKRGMVLAKHNDLSENISFENLPMNADKTKTLFLVEQSMLKDHKTIQKLLDLNREYYTVNGKLCANRPSWGYWSWYPWKVYAAYTNPEKTKWDYCNQRDDIPLIFKNLVNHKKCKLTCYDDNGWIICDQ